jgi:segregation and condensation protein A
MNSSELINHLLFHKALISEDESGERIEEYLDLVRSIDSGMHIAITDEFEKSISLVFELVMEHHFDCWEIDLIKFAKLYLKKIRKQKEVDLVTAGKIVFMAWSILRLQSEELLSRADIPEEEEYYFEDWNIPYEGSDGEAIGLDYTSAVISQDRIPIKERIWHQNKRNVTLMELVSAFDEAKKDVEKHRILNQQKERLRELMNVDEDFDEKVHNEDLEEDIFVTWQRICMIEEDNMILADLVDGSRDDLISRFVSILHLAVESRIRVYQRRFPYGEIVIKNITPVEDRLKAPTVELVTKEGESTFENPIEKEIVVS